MVESYFVLNDNGKISELFIDSFVFVACGNADIVTGRKITIVEINIVVTIVDVDDCITTINQTITLSFVFSASYSVLVYLKV
jgi:hypothetical protein